MNRHEFLQQARLEAEVLEAFIEAGWLIPQHQEGDRHFSDIDLGRACLIRDLRHDMGVNDEGISVILDLVDQMHGLRRTLRHLMTALHAQPAESRTRIIAEIRTVMQQRPERGA